MTIWWNKQKKCPHIIMSSCYWTKFLMARDFDICQLCVKFQHCRSKSLWGDRTHRITDLVYIDDINCRKRRKKIITRELCLRNLKHGILPPSGVLSIEKVICIRLEHSKHQEYTILHKNPFCQMAAILKNVKTSKCQHVKVKSTYVKS